MTRAAAAPALARALTLAATGVAREQQPTGKVVLVNAAGPVVVEGEGADLAGLLLARGARIPIRIEATAEEIDVVDWRPGRAGG